jgi:hypothetical protein
VQPHTVLPVRVVVVVIIIIVAAAIVLLLLLLVLLSVCMHLYGWVVIETGSDRITHMWSG